MDLNQLETFLAVLDNGSFSRAAERLNRTQPAVSLAIKRLEVEVGESLFDRTSKGGTLTEAGRSLGSYARRMLNLREEAFAAVRELQGLFRGRLSIGANESTSQFLLPPLLLAYRREHPAIKIEVFRNLSERIPGELLERNLDFGFLSYEPSDPRLVSKVIARDEMTLVVSMDHPLSKRKDLRIRDLGAFTFLAHNARTPSRERVVQSFIDAGVPLNISMELDSLNTIIDFVGQGLGAAILPSLAVKQSIEAGLLVRVPVSDLEVHRVLRIVHRKEQTLSSAAKAFLEIVLSRTQAV
jgi:DNA-binding transcriptional LysR family regulator